MSLALPLTLLAFSALGAPQHLAALTPTSGPDAAPLLDQDAKTAWRLEGDGRDEGVLLRFEGAVKLKKISVEACADAPAPRLQIYVNGGLARTTAAGERVTEAGFSSPKGAATVFVRSQSKALCLAEVRFTGADGEPLFVHPPRVVRARLTTSSTLDPVDAYHPAFLFDQRPDFGWVEGAKHEGAGEWIEVVFDDPVALSKIELWNGYQRSQDHFKKNARALAWEVQVDDRPPTTWKMKDGLGPQRLALPKPEEGALVKKLRLKVKKARRGSRYKDLVVSELRFHDVHGPFSVELEALQARERALKAKLASAPQGALKDVLDKRLHGLCVREAQSRSADLKLRANQTFVLYETVADELAGTDESTVFDGAWVPTSNALTGVKLYGRKHVIRSEATPYDGTDTSERVVIGGGALEIVPVRSMSAEQLSRFLAQATCEDVQSPAALLPAGKHAELHAKLAEAGAVVVKGKALMDVLVP